MTSSHRLGAVTPSLGCPRMASYPARWEGDVVLADGGTVHVRPIRPDDGGRLVALHGRLSRESVYFRYFAPRPRLTEREVRHLTDVDYERRMALVALLGDDLVGVARYDRWADRGEAEVAFEVDDAHQGRGIATVLLEHLAAAAREAGITGFTATVLPENRRMLDVFRSAGFESSRTLAGGVVDVYLGIEPTDATRAAIEAREQAAEARSVARLLAPRSIAVVGAGRRPGTLGHEVLRNLLEHGFRGPVHAVNRSGAVVAGQRAVDRVTDVPGDVDLAVIAVPAVEVPGVISDCAAKKVDGLIIISAGFAERGPAGAVAERALVEQARGHGMRLVGPNCMGVLNTAPDVRMHATFAPVAPLAGRVAFSSQSGPLGVAILRRARSVGLGFSTFVADGNKADVSGNDLLQFWAGDENTDVVLLYLESFGNPRRFSRLARRVSRTKPIVAVKRGRDEGGGGGGEVAVDALFQQCGVLRVDTLEQLFDVARLLVEQPLPAGRRVAVVGTAGATLLAADACVGAGLTLAALGQATAAALESALGLEEKPGNPLDLTYEAGPAEYERALRAVLGDPGVDAALVLFLPAVPEQAPDVTAAVHAAARETDKPVVATFLGGDDDGPESGYLSVTTFEFPEAAAAALGRVAAYADWRRRPAGAAPGFEGLDRETARRTVAEALEREPAGSRLDLPSTLALLDAYGIAAGRSTEVGSAEEAAAVAAELGVPVALKAGQLERLGKVEAGGLALDLQSPADVAAAYGRMARLLGDAMRPAIVEPMVASGVDTLVSVRQHPTFGPVVTLGLGGAMAAAGGVGALVLPVTDVDVDELVRSVPVAALLFDEAGEPTVDVDALEELLLRVGALADDLVELAELWLNPVIVSKRGAVAVGVGAAVAPPAHERPPPIRRLG
jgi:acyl-CoA synthetase (NDP forming)/GNAT superfamily N-acetyltransferase